jgi:hypothetical protein
VQYYNWRGLLGVAYEVGTTLPRVWTRIVGIQIGSWFIGAIKGHKP